MAATIVPTLLNRKDYDDWSSRMKTYLVAEDLWDVVEGTYDHEDKALWKKKDAKALCAIQNSCGADMYKIIKKNKTTAKDTWDILVKTLKRGYDGSSVEKDTRAIDVAYPQRGAGTGSDVEAGLTRGPRVGNNGDDITETFVKSVKSNDWFKVLRLLVANNNLANTGISSEGTVLHHAIQRRRTPLLEFLVALMSEECLQIRDAFGRTALYLLIREHPESVFVARMMVDKSEMLLKILPNGKTEPLFVEAERQEKGERMARFLYSRYSPDPLPTLGVSDGALLISLGFRFQRFDIAWKLIQRYPQLAVAKDNDGDIPLVTLASNRFAFLSGSRLSLWEKLIYHGVHIEPLPFDNESDRCDKKHPISSGLFRGLVTTLQNLLGINQVYDIKLMHKRVDQLLPLMCEATKDNTPVIELLKVALCVAAERGHIEYITHLSRIKELSPISSIKNEKCQSLFQIAAESRHFQIIYDYNLFQGQDTYDEVQSDQIRVQMGRRDSYGNNMLHTVASVTPLSKIDHIRGAALQIQKELQWFKEMESHAYPRDRESLNEDNMTPREVFTENHKEMRKEAERSMKETATSCTVVGALIVTIMFAAAFTVPGGNDEKTGLPKFSTKKVFIAFIFSDAISLFSSTTSVIMFLGILTSRYSENDFLKSLPMKMIIGLFSLFLSITSMMIVFSCALYIMLEGKLWVVIPSILFASVPVASFIWMQFPLLVELFNSTFGRVYLLHFKILVGCIQDMYETFAEFLRDRFGCD